MKEEKLVKKWLKNELSEEELKAFKQLDAYSSYINLSETAKYFKAPKFDEQQSLKNIQSKLEIKQESSTSINPIYGYIAAFVAVLIISFAIINYTNQDSKLYQTQLADSENITLPDQSEVDLAANSTLSFEPDTWNDERSLNLDGEAYFIVEKGETFKVNTSYGDVEVLGTKFNVKSRAYGFEVTCFEGSVQVSIDEKSVVLVTNDFLTLQNGSIQVKQIRHSSPYWKKGRTTLKSKPISFVLEELKNYYDFEFDTSKVDTSRLYSGSFPHNNINIALKSITLPLDLTYQISDKKVILSNK